MYKTCATVKLFKVQTIQAWTGFQSMTSAIPVQGSTELTSQLRASHIVSSLNTRRWWRDKWIYERTSVYFNIGILTVIITLKHNLRGCEIQAWKKMQIWTSDAYITYNTLLPHLPVVIYPPTYLITCSPACLLKSYNI